MIAVIDYSLGNIYSVSRSLEYLGIEHMVTGDPGEIMAADKLILPGVGAFRDAASKLSESGLNRLIVERARAGTPLMGICLGMQLLFEVSYEYGEYMGLGLMRGAIRPIEDDLPRPLKIPQIGWNSLNIHRPGALTKYLREGDYVYYVHSYYATGCSEALVASSEYGVNVPGIVESGNVMGCQFHPEKSGQVGLNILRAFDQIT